MKILLMRFAMLILSIGITGVVLAQEANRIIPSVVSQQQNTIVLVVENMTCRVCPITVRKAIEKVKGVRKVEVNYDNRTATVMFDPGLATVSDLMEATKQAGYPSRENE